MSQVKVLINSFKKSRASYLNMLKILSKGNIELKKNEYSWNIIETTEHVYWAEFLRYHIDRHHLQAKRNIKNFNDSK